MDYRERSNEAMRELKATIDRQIEEARERRIQAEREAVFGLAIVGAILLATALVCCVLSASGR